MTWPERVKRLRARLGLTQERFAQLLGCTVGAVRQWEQGRAEPRVWALVERLQVLEKETAQEGKGHAKA